MVVVTSINTTCTLSSCNNNTLHSSSANSNLHLYTFICRPTSPSLFYLQQLCKIRNPLKPKNCSSSSNGTLVVKGYMEDSNSVAGFANKVIGALPLVGLVARIFSDVGGVGGDIVDFAEFRRRVGNNSSVNDSRAFIDFQERRGRAGDPIYVLACCWLAAVGAGLLKSEEILEGVSRLRLSNDIEFEEETFLALMKEAKEDIYLSAKKLPRVFPFPPLTQHRVRFLFPANWSPITWLMNSGRGCYSSLRLNGKSPCKETFYRDLGGLCI